MIEQLQEELRTFINPEKASFFPRFFKTGPGEYAEGDKFLGVTVPHQRALAKKYYKRLTMAESLRLLKSEWHEERLIALFVLVLKFQKGEPQTKTNIFDLYIENTQYINNWDLVDASADKIVERAVNELMPHHLCNYLYELAQKFNSFYEHNRVLGDERERLRIHLVGAYADTLKNGLALLGINAPERM